MVSVLALRVGRGCAELHDRGRPTTMQPTPSDREASFCSSLTCRVVST
jgi:hypothetical protein